MIRAGDKNIRSYRPLVLLLACLSGLPIASASDQAVAPIVIMDFTPPFSLDTLGPEWHHRTFFRTTPMAMSLVNQEGYDAIRLETEGGGSIWGRHVTIDVTKNPILAWSWKVESQLDVIDETDVGGDDHPARLFLSFATPEHRGAWNKFKDWFFSRFRGIPYHGRTLEIVWGNNYEGGFSYRIHDFPHYVQRGGKENINQWWDEEINVTILYRKFWPGEAVPRLLFIGLMNDTEVAKQKAVSYFADIRMKEKQR